jgi:hypothetical protein
MERKPLERVEKTLFVSLRGVPTDDESCHWQMRLWRSNPIYSNYLEIASLSLAMTRLLNFSNSFFGFTEKTYFGRDKFPPLWQTIAYHL